MFYYDSGFTSRLYVFRVEMMNENNTNIHSECISFHCDLSVGLPYGPKKTGEIAIFIEVLSNNLVFFGTYRVDEVSIVHTCEMCNDIRKKYTITTRKHLPGLPLPSRTLMFLAAYLRVSLYEGENNTTGGDIKKSKGGGGH